MSREEDKARLNQEIARLKQMHADRYGEFKLIELAAVRLGILASYACRLLETPFVFLSTAGAGEEIAGTV